MIKTLWLNLSKEISNLSNGLSKSIKEESNKLGKSIAENNVVTSASFNKEFKKLMQESKKNQNTKLLKELSNSTSSLNAALEAISSQNKMLVKEIRDQKESITFPYKKMAEAEQKKPTSNFLIKIDKIRKKSYANSIFLKPDDVIVALNNQFYIYGEKRFVEELKDLKKSNERAILTILRNDIFIDIIIENSLGCGFITTDSNETEKIKNQFSKKNNYDIDELNEYVAMRDVYRRYDVYENS